MVWVCIFLVPLAVLLTSPPVSNSDSKRAPPAYIPQAQYCVTSPGLAQPVVFRGPPSRCAGTR